MSALTPELRTLIRGQIDQARRRIVRNETVIDCIGCGGALPTDGPARRRRFCSEKCRKRHHWRHGAGSI